MKHIFKLIIAVAGIIFFQKLDAQDVDSLSQIVIDQDYQTGEFTDLRDKNVYKWVQIGDQIWMAENLRYFNRLGKTGSKYEYWISGFNGTDRQKARESDNYLKYGVLYNYESAKKRCPDGWHLPSDFEWKELEMYLGMSQPQAYERGYRGTNEGSKLAGNADLWTDNTLVSNAEFGTSGFMALPAGYRYSGGTFVGLSTFTGFWSATEESDASHTWDRCLYDNRTDVSRSGGFNTNGFSVRCVMD